MIRKLGFALLAVSLFSTGICQQAESDSAQIEKLTGRFFQAIAQKDLQTAMSVWKQDSPHFIAAREDLRKLFAPNRISRAEARPGKITFAEPDRARAYASTEIDVYDSATGAPVEGFGRKNKLFDWVREAGVWKIERYQPAEAELADALIAAASAQDRAGLRSASKELLNSDLVRVLCTRAYQAATTGHPEEAVRLSDIAIETAESLGDEPAIGRACIRKAITLRDQSTKAMAETLAKRALGLFQKARDQRGEVNARRVLGSLYTLNSEFKDASREFEASLKLAKEIHDRTAESAACEGLGEINRRMGNLDEALKWFERSLEIDRALQDRSGEASELVNIANIWMAKSEFQKALDLYRQGLSIDEELVDKQGQAVDWGNIANGQDALLLHAEEIESLEKSRKLHIETGDRLGQAMDLNTIGLLLKDTGQPRPSLGKFTESLALAVDIHDRDLQCKALSNRGTAHQLLGDYGAALLDFQASLRLEQEAHNRSGEAVSRGTIAGLYSDAGRLHEALESYAQTVPTFWKAGMKLELTISLQNMAALYQEMGKYDEAASGYQESLRIKAGIPDPAGEVVALSNLAVLYQAQHRLQKSIETARQGADLAHQIGNPIAEAVNTLALADSLQVDGKLQESRKAYRDALQLAEKSGAQDAIAGAYTGLGSIDATERNWSGAEANYEKAIGAVETMRAALDEPSLQMGFFSGNQKPYHALLSMLVALNRNEDALRTAERARARTLTELLERAKVDIYQGLAPEDRKELGELDAKVAQRELELRLSPSQQLLRKLEAARQSRDDLKRVLYLKAPHLAVQRGEAAPVDLADLKSLLPDRHAALLEYTIGEQGSWLFVLRGPSHRGGKPDLFVHPLKFDRQKLALIAHDYWEQLRKQGVEGDKKGRQLFHLLLAPAYSELADVSMLGIVPDGNLWLVPFAVLRGPDGQYLVQSKAIYYAPSLTALRIMDRMAASRRPQLNARLREGRPPFLLAGNPSLGATQSLDLPLRGKFSKLEHAEAELREISGVLGGRTDILLGADATEAKVAKEAGRHLVVHLATHGFYDSANPMYSGIVLAQPGNAQDDGIWEAREIAEQTLHTELVVVSACETALGQPFAGEGIIGLSWAFFVAGTPASLLTNWRVDDASTALLMRRFYEEWGIGNPAATQLNKAVALQRAQKWLLTQKPEPYYWAPFILIGAPR